MRNITFIALFFLALPGVAFAHATPVETVPASGAQLAESPQEVRIRFNERLEAGSSRIKVSNTAGEEMTGSLARVSSENPYVLAVPLEELSEGVYTASWSVVSSDDGHFTKGSFAFSIGSPVVAASPLDSVVVQITSYPEASAMFVEFMGNSILWGAFVMFALILRPLLREESLKGHTKLVSHMYTYIVGAGVFLGISGALAQILWKSRELASLHEIALSESFTMYLQTIAGNSALWRIGVFVSVGLIFFFFKKSIFRAPKFTLGEGLMLSALVVFAYFRAIVSHATANPFHPEISTFVNMLHLVEKDVWPGVLILLLVFFCTPARLSLLPAVIPRALAFLTANFALLSLTASYIIWLHLRDFENVSSTLWGENFLKLAAAGAILVGMHVYHVLALRFRPQLLKKYFGFSVSLEAGAAFMVIFFTSLVIITSPPLNHAETKEFVSRDSGAYIRLERSPYEDRQALLTLSEGTKEPTVLVGGEGGLLVSLSKRFEGGYTFPLALIENKETTVIVSAPRQTGYDVRAEFDVGKRDFVPPEGHGRGFDTFTLILTTIALAGVLFAAALHILLKKAKALHTISNPLSFVAGPLGIVFGVCAALALSSLLQFALGNDFKERCEREGNMWHLMLPMKAGVPTSQTPREGCMWGMGAYLYHFADEREYAYAASVGESQVNLIHGRLVAGFPAKFVVFINGADGRPAELFVDMEKLIHVVIVSKDQEVFAHVHPDDKRALMQEEIANSAFNVEYAFPKAGEYLVSVDYAHGLVLKSQQFVVNVEGSPVQKSETAIYASPAAFGGYQVALEYSQPLAGEVSTFRYQITKDGNPVELSPYLSAAMHIAVVKNDFSAFVHTHGEVHPPGVPIPPVIVRNGKIVHSMATMQTPARFALPVDAHVIFPEPGVYTMWGQFNAGGKVIPTAFTVRVE